MTNRSSHIETKLIHAGEPEPRIDGAVTMPIFQTAMFESAGEKSYHEIRYLRLNNTPNHVALHAKLAALENAEAALVTSSGMAAISTALLALLSNGDHFLAQNCLYGGTHDLVTKDLLGYGITHSFVDGSKPDTWEAALRPNTKLMYVESIANPLLDVPDLEAVVAFAKRHGLITLIDNTFASPVNFRPAEVGFDLSLHSATKYLNGHSDVIGGVVAGSESVVEEVRRLMQVWGQSPDPHATWLAERGLKTLAVRMERHNASGMAFAEWADGHAAVEAVHYPGLPTHPDHAVAARTLNGYGGMVGLSLRGGAAAADHMLRRLRLASHAPSLGGVETLVSEPRFTSHALLTPEDRTEQGITDGFIRVSLGIEDVEDIIADFDAALGSP